MSKHTPGPWVQLNGAQVYSDLGAEDGAGLIADQSDGWLIADCGSGKAFSGGVPVEISYQAATANARLIAAAPDLLEACEAAEWNSLDLPEHVRIKLQAAIAKAKGETA